MIYDNIKNIHTYKLSDHILQVLTLQSQMSPDTYQTTRVDLDNGCFLLPNEYITQIKEQTVLEAHRKYIDVMYMVEGTELIKVKATSALHNITAPYNAGADCLLAQEDNGLSTIQLTAGDFIILFPQDAHCPACAVDNMPTAVKKVIGKVQISK